MLLDVRRHWFPSDGTNLGKDMLLELKMFKPEGRKAQTFTSLGQNMKKKHINSFSSFFKKWIYKHREYSGNKSRSRDSDYILSYI